MLDLREAHRALNSLFSSNNIELDWEPAAEAHAKDAIKLLLNLGLIAGEGLIRGGRLSVDFAGSENDISISVAAEGERFFVALGEFGFDPDAVGFVTFAQDLSLAVQ